MRYYILALIMLVGSCQPAFAQLPAQRGPLGVPPSAAQIELGRKLFFDPRLSVDGSVSCSTCHDPEKGWADGEQRAIGVLGQVGDRHSPSIINASYVPFPFWDGRVSGIASQAILPEVNSREMGFQRIGQVVSVIEQIPGYQMAFLEAYGSIDPLRRSPVTAERLGLAIAAFESTIISDNAPIDKFLAGDKDALTADAKIGYEIFKKSNCTSCHKPPLYTDNDFHNNGMEFAGRGRIVDQGRYSVVPQGRRTRKDVRAFKTPTLREIQRTAPYNHIGSFKDLKRVVQHYNQGGAITKDRLVDLFIDPRIRPLGLTTTQEDYLVKFLEEAFASPNYPMVTPPVLP